MKNKIGNYVIVLFVILNLLVWLIFPPVNDGRENFTGHTPVKSLDRQSSS